jgi:hypothetical protein
MVIRALIALTLLCPLAATFPHARAVPRSLVSAVSYTQPDATTGRPVAVVDDEGAVVWTPGASASVITAFGRDGRVRWRGTVAAPAAVLGCARCPAAYISDGRGRLFRRSAVGSRDVTPAGRPVSVTLAPGVGPNLAAEPTWLTSPASGGAVANVLADSGITALRLPPAASAGSVLQEMTGAADRAGARVVVALPYPSGLRVGERELVEIAPAGSALDTPISLGLRSPEDQSSPGVCISPDGSLVAMVVPDVRGVAVWIGRFGLPMRRLGLVTASPGGGECGLDDRDRLVVVAPASRSGIGIVWFSRSGPLERHSLPGGSWQLVGVCGDSTAVLVDGDVPRAAIADRRRLRSVGSAASAGCTPSGHVWILSMSGRVRWPAN